MKGDKQKNHKPHARRVPEIYNYYVDEETNGEIYYSFETPEADYTVYFNPNEYLNRLSEYPFLLKNAYGFGFFQFIKHQAAIPKTDTKIYNTIERIIIDFYNEKVNAVLLYHCYYTDGKQSKRSKKFDRWYCASAAKDVIRKHEIDLEISTNGKYITHYIGYLISNANVAIDSVHREFENFALSFPDDNAK